MYAVLSDVAVRVVVHPQHTAYVGQTVILRCQPNVTDDVDWKYRATEKSIEDYVYLHGVMFGSFRNHSRFSVSKSNEHSYDLIISNVNMSDAGQYICIEEKGLGARHVYDLNVTGKLILHCW